MRSDLNAPLLADSRPDVQLPHLLGDAHPNGDRAKYSRATTPAPQSESYKANAALRAAAQKRRWRKHSRLPDTPWEEDRVAIVFRRMPKGETAFFDAAGKRKE